MEPKKSRKLEVKGGLRFVILPAVIPVISACSHFHPLDAVCVEAVGFKSPNRRSPRVNSFVFSACELNNVIK